jgi:two-component system sensor histidine kinase/response regulator
MECPPRAVTTKVIGTLLDLFRVELEERPTKIRNHLLAGQLEQAKGEAHSLKGAALSIGARNLGEAASAFEQLTDALHTGVNERLLGDLEKAVIAAIAALHVPADAIPIAEVAVVAEAAPG